jgi:hypothetical protein
MALMRSKAPEVPASIPGLTPQERAINLAGLLAQRSIQHLTISTPMATRTLAARTTDLPGELLANTPCTLACSEGTFSITSDQIHRISKP